MKKSNRLKIISIIVPVMLVAATILTVLIYQTQSMKVTREASYKTLLDTAEEQSATIEATINGYRNVLRAFSVSVASRGEYEKEDLILRMRAIVDSCGFTAVSFADREGAAYTDEGKPFNVAERSYFKEALKGNEYIEKITESAVEKIPKFVFSVPLVIAGEVKGVIFGSFNEDSFMHRIPFSSFGSGDTYFLCEPSGRIIVGIDGSDSFVEERNVKDLVNSGAISIAASFDEISTKLRGQGGGWTEFTSDSGDRLFAVFSFVGVRDWIIVNCIPFDAAGNQNSEVIEKGYVSIGVVTVISLILLMYVAWINKTRREQLEREKEAIRRSEELYKIIDEFAGTTVFVGDFAEDSFSYNSNFSEMFLYDPFDGKLSAALSKTSFIYPKDEAEYREWLAGICCGKDQSPIELRILSRPSGFAWHKIEYRLLRDSGGSSVKIIGKIENIDAQRLRVENLSKKARTDPLTGLDNRESAKDEIDSFLAVEGKGGIHAFMMVDLDNFKLINDVAGHIVGDRVLMNIAGCISRMFKGTDVVARIGGDEFAVFLKNIPARELICNKAQELCDGVRFVHQTEDGDIIVSCSVGVAIYDFDGETFDELYRAADSALYNAKEHGKNRVCLCSPEE